jgi:hypothetical protein
VVKGERSYAAGHLDEAAETLATVIRAILRNPATFVQGARYADVLYRALATLAIVRTRSGDAVAGLATMRELVRAFPSRPLPRADYGPDGERLYREAVEETKKLGRGRLVIEPLDQRASVYVDGQIRGAGRIVLGDLIPGTYRVLVLASGTRGHQYEIEVVSGAEAHVDASAADAWLQVTDRWVGFSFPSDAERSREAEYAGEIARRWTGGGVVAVVGSARLQNKPALVGTVYKTDGTVLRSAVVTAAAADHGAVTALAQFLTDGTIADGIEVVQSSKRQPRTAKPTSNLIPRPALFWSGIGSFAAALIGGGLAIKFAGDAGAAGRELQATCAVSCTTDQERAILAKQDAANQNAIIFGVVGGVAVATSVVLVVTSLRHRRHAPGVSLVPLRGGAAATFSVRF